jgi:hypothetical protein
MGGGALYVNRVYCEIGIAIDGQAGHCQAMLGCTYRIVAFVWRLAGGEEENLF